MDLLFGATLVPNADSPDYSCVFQASDYIEFSDQMHCHLKQMDLRYPNQNRAIKKIAMGLVPKEKSDIETGIYSGSEDLLEIMGATTDVKAIWSESTERYELDPPAKMIMEFLYFAKSHGLC